MQADLCIYTSIYLAVTVINIKMLKSSKHVLLLHCGVILHSLHYIYLGTSLLCFYFYPLCDAAVLLKLTFYAQYYAQKQEFLSDYFYIQFCMNNSQHVADNFYNDCFIRVC